LILSKRPDIERFLAAPPPEIRAAVIYGRDRAIVRERANSLAAKATARPDDPFDVALITEGDVDHDPARLEEELSALSLMGGRRLVRLRLDEKASVDKAAAEALKAHVEGRLNADAFFLVEAGALGRESGLRKAAEASKGAAVIPCYEDEAGDVSRMIREGLAKDKVGLANEALELLRQRLPHERGVARQEIERLALFLGPGSGAVATPADLEGFLGVEPEASLADAATDAFGGRLAAVRAMGLHLGRLRRTLTLMKSGAGAQEAAKASGIFWKNEREFLRQAHAWTLALLDEVQPEVLGADKACKTSGSPDHLIAERLALTIAGRARRIGL
jgi:DNA polymerase-3 subunit delta